jgi:membrane protein implicated in regulation of membrane protease activity
MNFLKIILIGILVVFLAFTGMALVGMAFSLLRSLFWLFVIGLAAMALWKMFGPKGAKQVESADERNELQNTEMTLEEYKRKLEAQLKRGSDANQK